MRKPTELTVGKTQGLLQELLHRPQIACKLQSAESGCLKCCAENDSEPVSVLAGKEGWE